MQSLTEDQVQTQFGSTLLKVQREPVQISSNGKPVAVIVSAEHYVSANSDTAKELAASVDRIKANPEEELTDADEFMAELMAGKYD